MLDKHSIPLVSVLMTAYNRENYIREAIESVLSSTFANFELIIVDDGSTDKTIEIAQAYAGNDHRIKVFRNEKNLGDYPNRNKAASYARGTYIKYHDSDDIMYPYCLEVMLNCMLASPEAGYGLSASGDTDQPLPICLNPREAYLQHFSGKGHFGRAPGSSIIRKDAFEQVKGFSGLRQVGDFEFWLKIGCYFPLVKMPKDLYWSRTHTDRESSVNSGKEKYQMMLKVIKKIFGEEKVPLSDKEKKKVINSYHTNLFKRIRKKVCSVIKNY